MSDIKISWNLPAAAKHTHKPGVFLSSGYLWSSSKNRHATKRQGDNNYKNNITVIITVNM